MSVFRIICRDRIPREAARLLRWSPAKASTVAGGLNTPVKNSGEAVLGKFGGRIVSGNMYNIVVGN